MASRGKTRDPSGLSRRDALRIGAASVGTAAIGASACLPPNDRCAAGPVAGTPSQLLAHIDSVVVLMMENRSFDHFFGALAFDRGYPHAGRIDGLRGDELLVGPDGETIELHKAGPFQPDDPGPRHDWPSSHETWNGGRLDRFLHVNRDPDRKRVIGYYDREFLPFQYALADRYVVCDRWFSSVMGPTFPNRFYLHAATAEGVVANRPMLSTRPTTVWELMSKGCWSAKNYSAGVVPWYSVAFLGKAASGNDALVPSRIEEFFADARAGNLPHFALIDPDFKRSDHHPPHEFAIGEAFIASIFRALVESPQWPRTLFVLTYDEHGGFWDHVPPPTTEDPDPAYRQLGFRVPAIVAGPTVRPVHLESTRFEHVSILSTLRARYGIESLGIRMDAAADLACCVDPGLIDAPALPPRDLPKVDVPRTMATDADAPWLRPGLDLEAVRVRG